MMFREMNLSFKQPELQDKQNRVCKQATKKAVPQSRRNLHESQFAIRKLLYNVGHQLRTGLAIKKDSKVEKIVSVKIFELVRMFDQEKSIECLKLLNDDDPNVAELDEHFIRK